MSQDDVGHEAKRAKTNDSLIAVPQPSSEALILSTPTPEGRTSHLPAPTMHLTGHQAAVYSVQFNATGDALASGSFDKEILLWEIYGEEECKNYNVLSGHTNAVLDLKWSNDGNMIVSASADKTVAMWDARRGTRIRKCVEHTACVNSVAVAGGGSKTHATPLFATVSDDRTVKVWDTRSRRSTQTFHHDYQLLAVALSGDGSKIYTGGIDSKIQVWDLNKSGEMVEEYEGHNDSITGLSLSPDGKYLLSNAMDHTLRQWDVRPFVTGARQVQVFQGARHGSDRNQLRCAWSHDGEMVSAGSSDRTVHVWDVPSGQELYFLPGHKGTVNDSVFSPIESIVASGSSDKTIYLGELA